VRVERIDRLDDPRVADYRDLREAELRDAAGRFVVEGRLGVERLLCHSRFRPRSVFATPVAVEALGSALAGLDDRTPVYLAEQQLLARVVGYPMHRGCLAAAERGPELGTDELLARVHPTRGLVVALEAVSNPDNVGAIFRNAWAFGVDGVVIGRGCADPLYRKSVRVSMGGALFVPWARAEEGEALAERLRAHGLFVLALAPDGRGRDVREIGALCAGRATALVLGSEGEGLSAQTLAHADASVRIAMAPGVDSLNVATAAAIALHHLARLEP
jgi:tRNA G18 (ribose-2'-O)-methylase SpoU